MTLTAEADQHVSVTLESGARAPVEARGLIDELPGPFSLQERYDMRIALSEIVANSVRHGSPRVGDPVQVRISVTDHRIRCEVSDLGPGLSRNGDGRGCPQASDSSSSTGLRLAGGSTANRTACGSSSTGARPTPTP